MGSGQALDELSDLNDLLWVESDRRFIENEDRRIVQ